MTLDEQLAALGYVGLGLLAALAILLVLWLGTRQPRDGRARTFWRIAHLDTWLELLATLFRR